MPSAVNAPSSYAPILSQARQAPNAIAVVQRDGMLNYREFCQHIERVTRQLARHAFPDGARIAINIADPYLHHLVNIALSRLPVIGVSARADVFNVIRPHAVVSDRPRDTAPYAKVTASRDWLAAASDQLPAHDEPLHDWDAPVRLVLSSGTTGTPKMVLFTRGQHYDRCRAQIIAHQLTRESRFLTTMSMNTAGGLVMPQACWGAGGRVCLVQLREGESEAAVLRLDPNVLMVSTSQLEDMLKHLPPSYVPTSRLTVYVAGSVLPRALNRRARLRFGNLVMIYGSTEMGTVTHAPAVAIDTNPTLTGYIVPPAQVQVVDAQGEPVPPGDVGEVRIRNIDHAQGYLDDAETTAQAFRGGWFHPGDMGTLTREGALSILGRASELMNFGGAKIAPTAMEEALAGEAGVAEMAVFAAARPEGDKPCVAVVPKSGFDESSLRARYRKAYPHLPEITVFEVEAIPRNEMGKVLRGDLARSLGGSTPHTDTLH
jgi:acyl-CoA synthetase (AMP-forming)/AMP-acid ligase II